MTAIELLLVLHILVAGKEHLKGLAPISLSNAPFLMPAHFMLTTVWISCRGKGVTASFRVTVKRIGKGRVH